MPANVLRWAALALWLFWLAVYWGAGLDAVSSLRAATSRLDRALIAVIGLLTAPLLLTGLAICLGWLEASDTLALPGAALFLAGIVGTFYCRAYLGRFWTAETTLQADHRIVDKGPYGIVRHPIYAAASAMYLGTALVFPTWWEGLAAVLVVLAYVLKTRLEDVFLARHLAGYTDYQRRVQYRLVPRFW